jgi:hypothetical protein
MHWTFLLGAVLFGAGVFAETAVMVRLSAPAKTPLWRVFATTSLRSVLLWFCFFSGLFEALFPAVPSEGVLAALSDPFLWCLLALELAAFSATLRSWRINASVPSVIGTAVFSTMALIPALTAGLDAVLVFPGSVEMPWGAGVGHLIWMAVLGSGSLCYFVIRPSRTIPGPWSLLCQVLAMSAAFVFSIRLAQARDPFLVYALIDGALATFFGLWALFREGLPSRSSVSACFRDAAVTVPLSFVSLCSAMTGARLLPVELAAVAKRTFQALAGYVLEVLRLRSMAGLRPAELFLVGAMALFAIVFVSTH